jgi:hypothetical protein
MINKKDFHTLKQKMKHLKKIVKEKIQKKRNNGKLN